MTKFKALGTACLVAALAATSPALAAGFNMGGPRAIGGMGAPHAAVGASNARFVGGGPRGGFHHGGFGPGIAAGVIAGTALGAAAGYGYYDGYGYDDVYDDGYAVTGGYTCQPGTYFRGEDGRRYLCQ